jgi:VRR-NUC domain
VTARIGPDACDARAKVNSDNQCALSSASPSKSQQEIDALRVRRGDCNAEARIQAAIVEWIRVVAPFIMVFAVPNGGLRSKPEATRMRWTGVLAGVPDLAVVAPGGRIFFIEVKAPGGYLSAAQRAMHGRLVALGTAAATVRPVDEAREALAHWGIPTREATR